MNFKKIVIAEMTHAKAIAENIVQLNYKPTTKPYQVVLGDPVEVVL